MVRMRKEEAEMRAGNEQRITAYLEKRKARMDNVKPRNDLRRLIKHNLSERGPLQLAEKPRASSCSPRKALSDAFEESSHDSPYLWPSLFAKPGALSAREPRDSAKRSQNAGATLGPISLPPLPR